VDEIFYITKNNAMYENVQINISAKDSSYISPLQSDFYQSTDKLNQLASKLSSIE
jgi:hypothetical protein